MIDLEAIKARAEKASPGPWRSQCEYGDPRNWDDELHFDVDPLGLCDSDGLGRLNKADSEFIAHARTDIPALIARVEELEELVDRYHQTAQDNAFERDLND